MGLRDAIYGNEPVDPPVVEIAKNVFPDLWAGQKAPKYRLMLVKQYRKRDGVPPKNNRTRNQSKFDRAVSEVARCVERDGKGTIVKCACAMYDESDGATAQLIDDLEEIDKRVDEELGE